MALSHCGQCGTAYAVGLPRCPQCWAPDEGGDVPKITKAGVSFPADHDPDNPVTLVSPLVFDALVKSLDDPPGTPLVLPEESPATVTVAEQKAAGVAPEDTVTVAAQRAGAPPPGPPSAPPSEGEGAAAADSPLSPPSPPRAPKKAPQ